jgi:hypothetical protein
MKCLSVKKLKYVTNSKGSNFCQHFLTNWSKIGYNANDLDHGLQIKYLICFIVENSFIGITYYSILNMRNTSWDLATSESQTPYIAISYILFSFVLIYSCLRIFTNRIGALYCFKRLFLGASLGFISQNGGIDQNIALSLLLLVLI